MQSNDLLAALWDRLVLSLNAPLAMFLAPGQRLFLLYLATALVATALIYLAQPNRPANPLKGLVEFAFRREVWWHPSARLDYLYVPLNAVVMTFFFSGVLVTGPTVEAAVGGFLALLGQPTLGNGWPMAAAYTIGTVVAVDIAIFVTHWIGHRVPLFWEFHKIHHSARVLVPITVFRWHPVDALLAGLGIGILAAANDALFTWLAGTRPAALTIQGVNAITFIWLLLAYNLRHSQVWLSYPAWLSRWLMSPAMHQIHHSIERRHWDKNLGFVFSTWDRLAGTLYVPKAKESLTYGLDGIEEAEYDSIAALYFLPFRKIARQWLSRRGPAQG